MAATRFYFLSTLSRKLSSSTSQATVSRPRLELNEIRNKRLHLFDKEVKRQKSLISRLEKIEVDYEDQDNNTMKLVMNKGVSTPFNCAQHLSELLTKRSVLAEVNGELWDMHRPLPTDCTLKFIHMKIDHIHLASLANKAFWRSCSFLLGAVIENCFKEGIIVDLHSFPSANVRSGSFVYDVQLSLEDWHPSQMDLRQITAAMVKLSKANNPINRLEVDAAVALRMFEDNVFKSEQIPLIAAKSPSGSSVTLYKVGDHIDISRGPMISSSGHIGQCSIAAVHKLDGLYRFQGLSLPNEIHVNHVVFETLESRARKLNPARIPEVTRKPEIV